MSTIAIMQPYLFPYLGYYQLISAVDTFVLYDSLNYIKSGWVNRNRLLAVNSAPFFFIVPVLRKSSFSRIRDIRIKEGPWRTKLLRSICVNYKRAVYFDEVFPMLESIITCKTDHLATLNKASVLQVSNYLGINTEILTDPEFDWLEDKLSVPGTDLASLFPDIRLRAPSKKMIRAVAVCRSLNAEKLVNPAGGASLYPKEEFARHGIEISFLKMKEVRYRQSSTSFRKLGLFYPQLSIIDVLMNCGKKGTFELLNEFVLD